MDSPKIFNSVLLVVVLIMGTCSSISLHFSEDNSKDLISATCNHTLYYEVSDLQGLADIALNVSIAYGVETVARIGDLKSEAKGNDTLSSCLDECTEEYSDAVENLQEVVEALNTRSSETVKTLVSSAMTNSDTCEESFEETPYASPLVDRNQYFSKLCSNVLAITTLLS
ncbi:hypothetical protein P3X46_007500 [Hevea brasiliensis]|uniref:Pectinesterase inhibitor domain-containing protein n=1 Tax=Hevea brasiliensis TaxID=3981 RepID=A0ABQ9MTP3_HEVBR|nr:hypothetical protein P3X46_007500 [Hevea brasiliensis]